MLDLSKTAYFYAQALDNSGDVAYWKVDDGGVIFQQIDSDHTHLLREKIDHSINFGQQLFSHGDYLECRATWNGEGVITIKPLTLDINGRISPVLLLLNIYGESRSNAAAMLRYIPELTGRKLSEAALDEIKKLQRLLNLPRLLLLLVLLLSKLRNKN